MPESTRDRPTKAHEYMFLLSKSERYYYDSDAIKEPMAAASMVRLAQDLEGQTGSSRANGGAKTNGNMKAVGGSKGAFGPPQSRTRAKGNTKTFRGGEYTGAKASITPKWLRGRAVVTSRMIPDPETSGQFGQWPQRSLPKRTSPHSRKS